MANYEPLPRQESEAEATAVKFPGPPPCEAVPMGWTAQGMPVGDPANLRSPWETGIFSCFGKSDEFYSSDVEVCLLGSIAPCVLHGTNSERLGGVPGTFTGHCLPYTGLYMVGNCVFGWNCLAPWYSCSNRTAIRHQFNLEGSCERIARLSVFPGSYLTDEEQLERCESICDLGTHVLCHPCALCQEAREVRRRVPHPAMSLQPVGLMMPPPGQSMDHHPSSPCKNML